MTARSRGFPATTGRNPQPRKPPLALHAGGWPAKSACAIHQKSVLSSAMELPLKRSEVPAKLRAEMGVIQQLSVETEERSYVHD
jgi:hypothetical protein